VKSKIISVLAIVGLAVSSSVLAADMPEMAKKNNYCSVCHKIDEKSIGPSWMDISKFYNGKTDRTTSGKTLKEAVGGEPVEEFLVKKITMGGHGNWGNQPMLPNDYVYQKTTEAKQQDIKALVKYIMGLAK
jgi:cytochrome c